MKGTKDLTKGDILSQLFKLAMPIMATSFIQMAYNLTDMAWVGRIGSEAVAAIGSVGILTWMSISISLLTKVGTEVSVAQAIGLKDEKAAKKFASHNITLALIISVCIAIILLLFANPIINIYNLNNYISSLASSYLRIVATALPFLFLSGVFTGIYNAAGKSKTPFVINGIGLVTNMILDPVLIFAFDLGTMGAAIGTWLSHFMVFAIFVYELKFRKVFFNGITFLTKLKKKYLIKIIKIGLPVATLNTLFSIISMNLGKVASQHGGHIGLMTLTTGGQIEAITWNTSQGFSTALSAFVSQNFAAGKIKRVLNAFKITLWMTLIFGALCSLLFIIYGKEIFSIFVPEKYAYTAGGIFLVIDGYSQMFMMLEIATQGIFYGIGKTLPPAIISITLNYSRIPLSLWLISLGYGVEGIWWSICITSILKGISCLTWFLIIKKKALSKNNAINM